MRRPLWRWLAWALLLPALSLAAGNSSMPFRIPAGDAANTLAEFARQSGEQLIYLVDNVRGAQTRAVAGRLAPADALAAMLEHTSLTVHRDPRTGAMIVVRRAEPPLAAARPAPRPAVSASADEIVKLPEFTVASTSADRYRVADAVSAVRVRASLLETPSSVSVLTRDAIDDVAPVRIFDATRFVAGVEEGRGNQFSDRQIIRGFESNGRTVDNFYQTGADNIDEAVIDRIEISKGPNAILAPAGVPGGSINVITKSPSFAARRSVTALVGLFDAQKLTVDWTGPLPGNDRLAFRVIAAAQDSRRYAAADARLRGKVFAPMLTWRISPQTQLTAKLIAAEHWVFREPGLILDPRVTESTAQPYVAPGFSYRGRNGIQPWSHVGTHTADAFVQLTSALGERIAVRVAANARYYFEDSTQEFFSTPTFNNRYNPYTGALTQDETWALDPATGAYTPIPAAYFDPTAIPVRADTQKSVITTTNLQADVAARQTFGPLSAQTVVGLALTHYDSVGRVRSGVLPPLDLTQTGRLANPIWAASLYGDLRTKQNTSAGYVNERLGILDDHVQFSGGLLRFDVQARSHDHVTTPDAPSRLDDYRWLGLGSLLVKPARNVAVYYTHSTNSTPVIANNLPLWRDGRQDEVGLKAQFFDERLSVTLAQFRIRQSNVAVPNPDHQTDPTAPEQLISDLTDHGFEFELTGGLTANLSVVAAYSRLRLRDSLGRTIRAVADENIALLANYRFRHARHLAAYAGVTWTGARAGDAPAENFTPLGRPTRHSFIIPAYTTTTLGASWRTGSWLVRLNIDDPFAATDRLRQGGGRVSGTGLTAASGLNVKVSTTFEW